MLLGPLLSLFVVIFHSHFLSQFSSVAVFTLQVLVMRCVKCIHRFTNSVGPDQNSHSVSSGLTISN